MMFSAPTYPKLFPLAVILPCSFVLFEGFERIKGLGGRISGDRGRLKGNQDVTGNDGATGECDQRHDSGFRCVGKRHITGRRERCPHHRARIHGGHANPPNAFVGLAQLPQAPAFARVMHGEEKIIRRPDHIVFGARHNTGAFTLADKNRIALHVLTHRRAEGVVFSACNHQAARQCRRRNKARAICL